MREAMQIKTLREEKRMSQRKLAEKIGVSPGAVAQWELGDTLPNAVNILALADALGCSIDALFGRAPTERTSA